MEKRGNQLKHLLYLVFLCVSIGMASQVASPIKIKDNNGYDHFLIFSKNGVQADSGNAYTAALRLNNKVLINTTLVASLAFKDGIKTHTAYYSRCTSETYSADEQVLYFNMNEASLRALSEFKVKTIRLLYKDDEFIDYKINGPESFSRGVVELIAAEK